MGKLRMTLPTLLSLLGLSANPAESQSINPQEYLFHPVASQELVQQKKESEEKIDNPIGWYIGLLRGNDTIGNLGLEAAIELGLSKRDKDIGLILGIGGWDTKGYGLDSRISQIFINEIEDEDKKKYIEGVASSKWKEDYYYTEGGIGLIAGLNFTWFKLFNIAIIGKYGMNMRGIREQEDDRHADYRSTNQCSYWMIFTPPIGCIERGKDEYSLNYYYSEWVHGIRIFIPGGDNSKGIYLGFDKSTRLGDVFSIGGFVRSW